MKGRLLISLLGYSSGQFISLGSLLWGLTIKEICICGAFAIQKLFRNPFASRKQLARLAAAGMDYFSKESRSNRKLIATLRTGK